IELLAQAGAARRLWFALREGARIAADWGADLYFSSGETVPLFTRCSRIASFRNANVLLPIVGEYRAFERLRRLGLRVAAGVSARPRQPVPFGSADSARRVGDAIGLPQTPAPGGHPRGGAPGGPAGRSPGPTEPP